MKKIKNILLIAIAGGFLAACSDLDIPPKNIMTNEAVYTEGGIEAYMAGLYNQLPMEDFNMSDEGDYNGFFFWNCIKWYMVNTGETVNRNQTGIYEPQKGYWSKGYQLIRQTNALIQDLPAYVGKLDGASNWIAEAKFIRAYTYFAMVKRYGGVPILETPQQRGEDDSSLWIARSSHEACIDFILKDLDDAIANMGTAKVAGRANNKYVAAAFKSRVALYAGSVARYGQNYNWTSKTDNTTLLCGIPASRANDYFQQAYEAAKLVEAGEYDLYDANADKEANFREIFSKADNSVESVFIRQYDKNNYVHSFDAVYCPPRMTTTYGDRYDVTLDWVELFDGLPLDATTGRIKTTDKNGNYLVYDGCDALLKNAEPRLKGCLLIPGQTYKGVELDMRAGIIKEEVDPATAKIQKFIVDNGKETAAYGGTFFNANVQRATDTPTAQVNPYVMQNGTKIFKNGLDGPTNKSNSILTGLQGAKWLNLSLTVADTKLHNSFQSWIDIRYAEVLLNRAEAALELYQNGVTSLGGDLRTDAFDCINKIRKRAGATVLVSPSQLSSAERTNERGTGINSFVFAPNEGMHIIRVERYKELAFEHKIYWDLRRWFTFDQQIREYRRRELLPFLFAKGATLNSAGNPVGKYIFDSRVCESANNALTFNDKNYFDKVPDSERKVNPLLEQNNKY